MSDQSGTPSPAAGWYTDPAGGGGQRYWDGSSWTEHVQPPAPEAPAAPPVAAEPAMPVAPAAAVVPPPPAYPPAPATPAYPAAPAYAGQQYAGQHGAQYGGMQYAGPPARSIGFGEAISRGFSRWRNYSDRATVAEYWWFYLFALLATIGVYVLYFLLLAVGATSTTNDNGIKSTSLGVVGIVATVLLLLWFLVLFLVQLPLGIRRLHDSDRSGTWILVGLIPFGIGFIALIVLFIMAGTPGPNQYGPPVS